MQAYDAKQIEQEVAVESLNKQNAQLKKQLENIEYH